MRRLSVLLALALGCPSSPPPEETTPEPEPYPGIVLDGQVLYAGGMFDIPQSVFSSWERFQEAWSQEPPMPPEDAGPPEYQAFATQRFAPYVQIQIEAASQLLDHWEEATDAKEQLLHAVLAARLLHRSASWMWTLPMPDVGQVDEAARASLEQSIRGAAKNFAQYAHLAFGRCIEAAADTPDLEPWRADCARRRESVEPIRTAQIGPPARTPLPEACQSASDPEFASPSHDPEARPQLLVRVRAEDGVDESELRRAVERWAQSEHGLRAVPAGRRRAAESLVDAGKVSRRGPECAAPPSLTWVLGLQIEHLVVASVRQQCNRTVEAGANGERSEAEMECVLGVRWSRAGTDNQEGLPPTLVRNLPVGADTAAVVGSLTSDPPEELGALGTLFSEDGFGASVPRIAIAEIEGNPGSGAHGALLRLGLVECQAERGTSQLQLAWTVTPTGAVESVTATGADDTVNACVKEKLEQLTLTCTPTGEPIPMQTTLCLAN